MAKTKEYPNAFVDIVFLHRVKYHKPPVKMTLLQNKIGAFLVLNRFFLCFPFFFRCFYFQHFCTIW